MKYLFGLILILIIVLSGNYFYKGSQLSLNSDLQTIKIGEKTYLVEVVKTPEARAKGLSGRESLAEDTGMIFFFEEPTMVGFWMKEMLFAIDIVWIDASGVIIGAVEEAKPDSFPQIFSPSGPIKYVLELPSGTVSKHGIDTGMRVFFENEF